MSFISSLTRLWQRPTTICRQPVTRHRLTMETLERRDVPTGNLSTSFFGGTLTVRVDRTNLGDENNTLEIIGTGAGSLTIQGLDGTLVNGASGMNAFDNVRNLVLDLGNGDDFVTAFGLDLVGRLTFNGGTGNDTLLLDGAFGDNLLGSLTFQGGADDDLLEVRGGANTIFGPVVINFGTGEADLANLGVDPGDFTTLGSVNVVGGVSGETVFFGGSDLMVNGNIVATMGGGTNLVQIAPEFSATITGQVVYIGLADGNTLQIGFDGLTTFSSGSVSFTTKGGETLLEFAGDSHFIDGNLSVSNVGAEGFDQLIAGGSELNVAGKLTVRNGNGGSDLFLDSSFRTFIGQAVTVTNGNGFDTVFLGIGGGGQTAEITTGSITINNGNDDSIVFMNATVGTINGHLNVTAGKTLDGFHELTILGEEWTINGKLTVNHGNATSFVDLTPATLLTVRDAVSVTTAEGDDLLMIGQANTTEVNLARGVTVRTGNGNSETLISGSVVTVTGPVSVTSLTGRDMFLLAPDEFHITGAVTLNFGNGDGSGPGGGGGSDTLIAPTIFGILGGALTVKAAADQDFLTLSNVNLRNVSITVGNDDSDVFFDTTVNVIGNVNVTAGVGNNTVTLDSQVSGNVVITTGIGDDIVNFGNGGLVTGSTTLNLNRGMNEVNVNFFTFGIEAAIAQLAGAFTLNGGLDTEILNVIDSTFNGIVTINTGGGDDVVNIAADGTSLQSTVFKRAVTINLGAGDMDMLAIGNGDPFDPANFAQFFGNVLFNGGAGGIDAIFSAVSANTFAGTRTIVGFEDGDAA